MPKEVPWQSNITEVGKNKLHTYGVDQEESIRKFHYEEMVFLLLFGRKPTETEADLLRAVQRAVAQQGYRRKTSVSLRANHSCTTCWNQQKTLGC